MKALRFMIHMERSISICKHCYYELLMIFQHMEILVVIVSKDIILAQYIKSTSYHQLKYGRKTCYIGHRKYLT